MFFLFLFENICYGYSLEVPQRGTSNEYPQYMFSWRNKKNIFPGTYSYLDLSTIFVYYNPYLFSTVILSLPLIQEGQLSVSGERMCTILVNRLED